MGSASGVPVPSGIIPRWEWRGFGSSFDRVDDVLRPLEPDSTGRSDERYVLSTHSNASVKLRDGRMDVKRLVDVDEHGLELWVPTMKADFPLSVEEVGETLSALGLTVEDPSPATTLDDLVDGVIADPQVVRVIDVHKQRTQYRVGECMVESTELTADDVTTRTVTAESPDPAVVLDTLARLGLTGRRNVSVARGLKAMVGFASRGAP